MSFKKKINECRRKLMRALTQYIGQSSPKTAVDDQHPVIRHILISRPNHRLGNQLLITPLVQEVQKIFQQAQIELFTQGNLAPIIFKYYPINDFIKLPLKPFKEPWDYLKVWLKIRKRKYDLVINAVENSSSGRISGYLSGAKYVFYGDELHENMKSYSDYSHIAKKSIYNLRIFLSNLGIDITTDRSLPLLDLKLSDEELLQGRRDLENLFSDSANGTIGLFTYATGEKCYGKEWWAIFYEKCVKEFHDFNFLEILPVENVSQLDFNITSYYSRDIRSIASVMHHCKLIIAADSGMMHLASASLTPTIGLFSVTDIRAYQPYGNKSRAFDTNKYSHDELIREMKKMIGK